MQHRIDDRAGNTLGGPLSNTLVTLTPPPALATFWL